MIPSISTREQFINLIHHAMDEEDVNIIQAATWIIDAGHKNRSDAVALYVLFKVLSAANEDGVEKGKITAHSLATSTLLGWTKQKYTRAKKILIGQGLVKDVIEKDKSGRVSGHYILVI